MALRYAQASGLWSASTTWSGGAFPGTGDFVAANGFIVTIDIVTPAVLYVTNGASSPAVLGGYFIFAAAGGTLNCSGSNGIIVGAGSGGDGVVRCPAGAVACYYYGNITANPTSSSSRSNISNEGGTLTIAGALGGTTQGIYALDAASSNSYGITINHFLGTTTIYGALSSLSAINTALQRQVLLIAGGTVNVYGTISSAGSTGATIRPVIISAGTLKVFPAVGFPIATNVITATTSNVIYNNTSGVTIEINGNVIATGSWPAIYLAGNSTINLKGGATASINSPAIVSNSILSTINVTGTINNTSGMMAIAGTKNILLNPAIGVGATPTYWIFQNAAAGANVQFQIPSGSGSAIDPGNVRFNVVYNGSTQVGTMRVPVPNTVQSGVPFAVGLSGTLKMLPKDFMDILTTDSIGFTAGTIGERLKSTSTVNTLGTLLTSYNG